MLVVIKNKCYNYFKMFAFSKNLLTVYFKTFACSKNNNAFIWCRTALSKNKSLVFVSRFAASRNLLIRLWYMNAFIKNIDYDHLKMIVFSRNLSSKSVHRTIQKKSFESFFKKWRRWIEKERFFLKRGIAVRKFLRERFKEKGFILQLLDENRMRCCRRRATTQPRRQ